MIRIGMAQILVCPEDKERNLKKIEEFIRKASQEGCDLVLLPECSDLGWANPYAGEGAESVPGPLSGHLGSLAKEEKIYVACGMTERDQEKLYNTALLIDDTGRILLKQAAHFQPTVTYHVGIGR